MSYCKGVKELFQEPPQKGKLSGQIGLSKLIEVLGKEESDIEVYAYIVTTVKWVKGETGSFSFRQEGCAPNFQGGVITLCTCKHWMRTWKDWDDWEKGVWIAGFTAKSLFPPERKENYLFYLMKVEKSFPSHKEIWNHLSSNPEIRNAKNAHTCYLGDLFQPRPELQNDFEPSDYYEPILGHAHRKKKSDKTWHNDINYKRRLKNGIIKRPALLIGKQEKSFLWFDRAIRFNKKLFGNQTHPRTKKWAIAKFKGMLTE